MSIPTYEQLMLPVLKCLSEGTSRPRREIAALVADAVNLSDEDRTQLLPSGQTTTIMSRVGWALSYLKQARILESPRRGFYQLTDRGRATLANPPAEIDGSYLIQFPEFKEFIDRARNSSKQSPDPSSSPAESEITIEPQSASPEEALESAYAKLRAGLEEELLDAVKSASPAFFEQLVVDLLVRMGYGGSRQEAARAVGKSGDGGIDGVIDEDRLGLDAIYIQAKRWEGTVGRPEIQKFAGALQGQRAKKGIFITTSSFSKDAHDYASRIESRIVLIDGHRLCRLMYDFDIGSTPSATYTIKRLDSDYFE